MNPTDGVVLFLLATILVAFEQIWLAVLAGGIAICILARCT
jgi:hypothetical protein